MTAADAALAAIRRDLDKAITRIGKLERERDAVLLRLWDVIDEAQGDASGGATLAEVLWDAREFLRSVLTNRFGFGFRRRRRR